MMSFNLNKSDGSAPHDPSGRSNFDLSKSATPNLAATVKKPKYWLWTLLVLVLAGAGTWYFTRANGNRDAIHDPASSPAVKAMQDTAAAPGGPAPAAVAPPAARALSNPVAASFRSGSSAFVMISQATVNEIMRSSRAGRSGLVNVNGYASSEGNLAFNQKISQERADVFKRYLVSKGMSENKIVATGKGIDNPVASNATEAGRRKNRRVEIIIP